MQLLLNYICLFIFMVYEIYGYCLDSSKARCLLSTDLNCSEVIGRIEGNFFPLTLNCFCFLRHGSSFILLLLVIGVRFSSLLPNSS